MAIQELGELDIVDETSEESFSRQRPAELDPIQRAGSPLVKPQPKDETEEAPAGARGFSQAEWAQIRAADWIGARNLVIILLGVFLLGLIGYTSIFFWIFSQIPQ